METETIRLPKQLVDSIRIIIRRTNIYHDETEFVQQAVMKQLMKFKEI